ncbi:MAG: PAS domain S-box protein [Blastocatellia bacterium]
MTATHTRILLVENDPLHARIVEGLIASDGALMELAVASRFSEMVEHLKTAEVDLVLLDLELPDSAGSETYLRLRAHAPDLPVVILTATGNDEIAKETLAAGAQDYLVKWQMNAQLLQRSILYAVERKRRELRHRERMNAVQRLADALPGIFFLQSVEDRRVTYFSEQGGAMLPAGERAGGGASLLNAVHPEDRERLLRELEELEKAAPEIVGGHFVRMRNPAGEWRWMDCHSVVFSRDEAGNPKEILCTMQDVTERRQSEGLLRESEERLRLAMSAARMGAWEWNPATGRLICDEYVRTVIDLPAQDMEAWLERVYPEDRAAVAAEARRLAAGGEIQNLQFRVVDETGKVRWVQTWGMGLGNASGRPGRLIGVLREITEWKQSEEYSRLLSSVVRNSQDGILITTAQLDPPGPEILSVNPAFCAMTGYSEDELIGATPRLLQGEKTSREFLDRMREQLRGGEGFSGETINYRKDGTEYSVDWQITPVRDLSGEITHFISIQRNISASRRNEERLRQQAALLDGAQDAIIIRDIREGIVYWNQGAERLYGWTAEEARGRMLEELLHRDVPHEYEKARATLISHGKWHGELRQVTKDGREVVVECRWTAINDAEQKLKSILVINTDVTEKKRLESMAMRAQRLESIGALASGIAHDLNNVLAPILMALHTLQQRFTDENSQRWLSLIHKSAERGRDLIDQVLSFAKGVEGERAPLQVSLLITDIEKILKETLPRNIELQVILPEGLWTVIGDTTQIHQVLMNLCINARDAMPAGGRLLIKARNRYLVEEEERLVTNPRQKQYVRITVADTGVGIPPEILDRVFDPFFTTKGKGQGSGLGLAMVQGIVRGHGGFVNVLSRPGQGTEFKIYIPAQDLPIPEHAVEILVDLPSGNGELILVVDDEADIREVTSRTLENNGYRVLVACDGAEAIEIFREHVGDIQLVLTDMVMPNLDGPGAIRAFKEINPDIRVVATSGVKTTGKLAEATREGVKTFLPKPYTADLLLSVIAETLDSEVPARR